MMEIPLTAQSQTFTLSLSGVTYHFTLLWREQWVLDIADSSKQPLVNGIPLVAGVDLLAPYRYLGFSGVLCLDTENPLNANNLGHSVKLLYEERNVQKLAP